MSDQPQFPLNPMAIAVNSVAIALTLVAFMGDCAAFLGWLYLGVLDGHWNDISLQILLVCLIVSFTIFLLVAAFFGLGNRLSRGESGKKFLSDLGALIDSGWEKALRMSMTCMLIALSLLVGFLFSGWRDILWWSDFFRASRAETEFRLNDAHALYQAGYDIATEDRKPLALLSLGKVAFDQKDFVSAERHFTLAALIAKKLPGDNRNWLVQAQQALAKALIKQNKLKQAESTLNQSITVFGQSATVSPVVMLRLLGPLIVPAPYPPPTLIGTYVLLELTYAKQGDFEKTYATFERNLDAIKSLPRVNPQAIVLTTELFANLITGAGAKQADYLDRSYGRAMELIKDKFPDDKQTAGRIEASYAARLRAIGANDRAEKLYLEALENLNMLDKGDDTILPRVMNNLAAVYVATKQPEEAEKIYKQEQELLMRWQPKSSDAQIQLDSCRSDYASLLHSLNRDDEAKKIEVRRSGK